MYRCLKIQLLAEIDIDSKKKQLKKYRRDCGLLEKNNI